MSVAGAGHSGFTMPDGESKSSVDSSSRAAESPGLAEAGPADVPGAVDRRTNGEHAAPPPGALTRAAVHELRTPLTAIHGYAQLLARGLTNQEVARRAVDVILRETTRLSELLNNLSEVAEVDSNALTFVPVELDVVQVARGVVERAVTTADGHELVVVGEGTVVAHADPRRLSQVLSHLISNAIKYTPDAGRISIQIERQDRTVHIAIADPGIGVDPTDDGRIYERFYRGRNAEQLGVRGLGLGLHIVREIVARAGGRVWHESGQNGGTVFHVTLSETPTE